MNIEYKVIKGVIPGIEQTINGLAQENWKVVSSCSPFNWEVIVIMERQNAGANQNNL